MSATLNSQKALTAAQRAVFDDLLAVGGPRPVTPPTLASELAEIIEQGCAPALARWPETRLWLSKSQVSSMLRCEGSVVASAAERREGYSAPIAIGVVSHRAIQISHTHPHLTPSAAVDAAIEASRDDERFSQWWDSQSVGSQSDLLCQMISRAVGFLDAFPPLPPNWVPRFEESIQARFGKLVLSARPDLVLGRPRPDMRQTMFLCDFKTGSINDAHHTEAMFYALVATLRFGTAPFRSTVFSVASGEWTDPEVSAEQLRTAAATVVDTVTRYVDVILNRREPTLTPDRWCTWCPARTTCAVAGQVVEIPTTAVQVSKPDAVVPRPRPKARTKSKPSVYDID